MKPSSPRGSIKPDAGPERALFRILGMIATCLGALSGQAPKPAGAAPLARGLDGESALRAIMANAMGRSSWNTTGTGLSRKSTLEQNTLQPLDNLVRPEVVTHVIGTFRYLCLRSGQSFRWCRGRDSNPRPTHYECVALPAELPRLYWVFSALRRKLPPDCHPATPSRVLIP